MKAEGSFSTLVSICKSTRHYHPESHLSHTHHHENLKSNVVPTEGQMSGKKFWWVSTVL
jgi:hypothetical protein